MNNVLRGKKAAATTELRQCVMAAYGKLSEKDREEMDDCAQIIVSHVKLALPNAPMSHEGALELLAAVGQVLQ